MVINNLYQEPEKTTGGKYSKQISEYLFPNIYPPVLTMEANCPG